MKRIEFRALDHSCSPYLTFSAIVAAGLDGIVKKQAIGNSIDEDIFKMNPKRRREMGIKQLLSSLREAYETLESDKHS
jgi:glutamine synthetase